MEPFARVLAAPNSDAARAELAAAWKAAGDPRAELLDAQLRFDAIRPELRREPDAAALGRTVGQLLKKRGREFAGPIADQVDDYRFRRGLVATIELSGDAFVARAAELFALAPIQHVLLKQPMRSLADALARPEIAQLATLHLDRLGLTDADAKTIAAAPSLADLRWLTLSRNAIGLAGVEALAASASLARVLYVNLDGNPADPTPYVHEDGGARLPGRPALAETLEARYGRRPWLDVPARDADWPPRDEAPDRGAQP